MYSGDDPDLRRAVSRSHQSGATSPRLVATPDLVAASAALADCPPISASRRPGHPVVDPAAAGPFAGGILPSEGVLQDFYCGGPVIAETMAAPFRWLVGEGRVPRRMPEKSPTEKNP